MLFFIHLEIKSIIPYHYSVYMYTRTADDSGTKFRSTQYIYDKELFLKKFQKKENVSKSSYFCFNIIIGLY